MVYQDRSPTLSQESLDQALPNRLLAHRVKLPSVLRHYCSRLGWAAVFLAILGLFFFRPQRTYPLVQRSKPSLLPSRIDDVHNQTLGFEKVIVVGLPSRTDRRDRMVLQAAISDIDIDFIDGVQGAHVLDKVVPLAQDRKLPPPAVIGSWRAHMNAIREVVERNLSTALIIEDDVDWDVRLRQQLQDFAQSTQALLQPLQKDAGTTSGVEYADPSLIAPSSNEGITPSILFDQLPSTIEPQSSPYGDSWDVLWIGHCGMQFPSTSTGPNNIPRGRVIQHNDTTVPEKRYMWSLNNPFTLVEDYPQHTRAVHHVQEGVCSLAYAVSQHGARRILQEIALKDVSDAFDILLRFFCEGARGMMRHTCLTTEPGLFHHHRPAGPIGASSDIGDHGEGFRVESSTDTVRWSTRLNADVLMNGGAVFHDQYPDSV